MSRMRFTASAALAFVAALATAQGSGFRPTGPTKWVVIAGSEAMLEPTEHGTMGTWQNLRFYPDHLAISEGDTIIFSFRTSDTHNVVFMPKGVKPAVHYIPSLSDPKRLMVNPLALAAIGGQHFDGSAPVSSGLINAISGMPKEWRVTLATPGIWTYVCTPYSTVVPMAGAVGMVGRIEVRKAGSTLPLSPEEVTSAADKAVAVDIAADEAADVAARKITSKAGPKGSTVWTMNAGYTTASSGERMRFGASDLTIKVGDIVEWVAKGGYVPHNVYFFSGGDEMPMTIKEGNILYVNQDVEKAVGSQVYDGTGVRSSGFIGEGPGRTKTYRLTFTKVGHYEYICIPHDEMGMMAYITVTE